LYQQLIKIKFGQNYIEKGTNANKWEITIKMFTRFIQGKSFAASVKFSHRIFLSFIFELVYFRCAAI
jgi:hypothetical protein